MVPNRIRNWSSANSLANIAGPFSATAVITDGASMSVTSFGRTLAPFPLTGRCAPLISLAAQLSPCKSPAPIPSFSLGRHGRIVACDPIPVEPVEHGAGSRVLRVRVLQGGAMESAALPAHAHGEDGQ